jgi:hypothetical protein
MFGVSLPYVGGPAKTSDTKLDNFAGYHIQLVTAVAEPDPSLVDIKPDTNPALPSDIILPDLKPWDLPSTPGGADMLVIEARPPPDATRPGGNAARFDWSLLGGWTAPAPWILAGGLTVANVADAIRTTGAKAVDVSSGVERTRGEKDPALIRAFIANARSASLVRRTA